MHRAAARQPHVVRLSERPYRDASNVFAMLLSRPACAVCGKLAETGPTCLLLPGLDPLCWDCAAGLEGSVVSQARGPVILYRPARAAARRAGVERDEDDGLDEAGPFMLSAREQEVVQLVASGLTNMEIAMRLKRSKSTIAKHVSHALAKRHARNRAELVAAAFRSGLAAPGPAASADARAASRS